MIFSGVSAVFPGRQSTPQGAPVSGVVAFRPHQRSGRCLFREGVRHHFPGRARRSKEAREAHDVSALMIVGPAVLAGACILLGVFSFQLFGWLRFPSADPESDGNRIKLARCPLPRLAADEGL